MMRRGTTGLLALLILCWAVAADHRAAASNWPRFRGPNGTGISFDKDVPVHWSEKDGVLWKTELPGAGHSSPVVWGDRVFLQSATADGKQRLLLCLDATDGKILWSRSVPGIKAHAKAENSLATSTPATDGLRVYAQIWDGTQILLQAYDLKGNLLWNQGLGTFTSQHGAGASPIVFGDKVIATHDQDRSAVLLALDAKTGKPAWQVSRPGFSFCCYSTPFLLEQPGAATELIVASTAGISSYDPDTGTMNWNWNWTFSGGPLRTVGSPVYGQGLVFATSGNGPGERHMVAVKAGGKGDVSKTNLVWENKKIFPYVPTMLIWGDHIYFVNDRGIAGCHVAKTGEAVWNERLGGTVFSSPVLIDGKIYLASEDGNVYVYPAAPTFKLLAKNAMGEPVTATPAVADNRLFIRGRTHLFCIGKASGK